MNKKFYGTLLLGTLLLGSTIVSCKDYDDDIDNLQNQITQLATKADMQSEVSKLQSAVATAQAAAENKAAAAEQAAKDAAAKAQAAADAAAKAQGTADAAATVEALNKVAAEAAAAAQAAAEAKTAAEAKAAELEAQLAELEALAATLVSTTDFEAAKKELNDKYAELAAKIGETTGVTGMTGINLVGANKIDAGYGVWAGVHNNMEAAEWDGPKAKEINAIEKGTKLAAWGVENFTFSVNPTDFDASKIEAFAIVNQFDEVAPIAFGAPKAVTRAAAGAWTLPVLGNAIYGEKAAEFEKNFSVDENGANGTVATLAAGQFAGALNPDFCTVKANLNADKTDFSKEIAIDEIDGTAVLEANDPTVVLDAYITVLKSTFEAIAHDSVVYKLAYTGTTLTYDAEAVKKFMSAKTTDQTIKVEVKQINLNGYIHTAVGTITFKAKEAAKPVVLERIQLDKASHTIVPLVWNKSEGKNDDNQKVTVSILPALKKWGIDLSKTTDEATIHWNHTTFSSVEVIADSVYYLKDDQTPVYLTDFATASLTGDEKDKKKNADLTLEFDDYKYKNVEKVNNAVVDNFGDDVDAAFNGKLIYIPVKMTGTDTDNGVAKTVEYSVVVPVQFNKANVSDYYQWNHGKDVKLKLDQYGSTADFSDLFEPTATYKNSSNSIVDLVEFEKPYFTGMDAEHKVTTTAANIKYVVPSVTVSGQNGAAYNKALADMRENGYTDDTDKKTQESKLLVAYTHAVSLKIGDNNSIYQGYFDVKQGTETTAKYKWAVADATSASGRDNYADEAPSTINGELYVVVTAPAIYNEAKYTDLLKNANYTVKGLTCKFMGREHVALGDLEVEVYTEETSAYTVEISNNAIYNDASAPVIRLANKFQPAVGDDAGKFSKTFAVTDKFGTNYEVASSLSGTVTAKIVYADGSKAAVSVGASATINVTVGSYAVQINPTNGATVASKNGLVFDLLAPITGAEAGDKLQVTIPKANFIQIGETSSTATQAQEDITFEFVIAE